MEKQTDRKVKVLRTDNGLEFCNDLFNHYCKEQGIMRHKSVRHTPQQNGVAERMNRTLLNKSRCMLFSSGLSKGFWGEAVVTAAYLINRCPCSAINLKTPGEVWSGNPPDLSNLRVFGCAAYAHQNIGKLEIRVVKGVFLGYPDGVKGYRIWLRDQGGLKTIISIDVIFKENIFPCISNNTPSAGIQTDHAGILDFEILQNTLENTEEEPDVNQVEPVQMEQVQTGSETEDQVQVEPELERTSPTTSG